MLFKKLSCMMSVGCIGLLALSGCGKSDKNIKNGPVTGATPLSSKKVAPVPVIKLGHVGHDHHLAIFVAADLSNDGKSKTYLKKIDDKKRYELYDNGKKIAIINFLKVKGGSGMPTAISQGVIDLGAGGIVPELAAIDKGGKMKVISPLHFKGDMLVVGKNIPVSNWKEFVTYCKKSAKPVRIGYKSPTAVAKTIFEAALKAEKIPFADNNGNKSAKVILVNVKGGGKLNMSLKSGIVDGYVGNNPFPAIGKEKGILKIVSDLENLPPGTMKNHPCCCMAASDAVLRNNPKVVRVLLKLLSEATAKINADNAVAVDVASRWTGASKSAEAFSIKTNGYSLEPTKQWHQTMGKLIVEMNKLGVLKKSLKGLSEENVAKKAYDFSLLPNSKK